MRRILVSNDDGIHAPGLRVLADAMREFGEVTVIAPLNEQSATSHALTMHHPLRVKEVGPGTYAVEGTPTDCVLLAVKEFLEEKPDLVVSGINQGPNLGEDVIYSGTVAAAMEGAILGIPSVALSLASRTFSDFEGASGVATRLARRLLERELPPRFLINVNVPPVPAGEIRGIRATRLGNREYNDVFVKKQDPRGRDYYWIGGEDPSWTPSPNSDFSAVSEGFVSVTPLLMDFTADQQMEFLESMELDSP